MTHVFLLGLAAGTWVPVVAYAAAVAIGTLLDWVRGRRAQRQGQ